MYDIKRHRIYDDINAGRGRLRLMVDFLLRFNSLGTWRENFHSSLIYQECK